MNKKPKVNDQGFAHMRVDGVNEITPSQAIAVLIKTAMENGGAILASVSSISTEDGVFLGSWDIIVKPQGFEIGEEGEVITEQLTSEDKEPETYGNA